MKSKCSVGNVPFLSCSAAVPPISLEIVFARSIKLACFSFLGHIKYLSLNIQEWVICIQGFSVEHVEFYHDDEDHPIDACLNFCLFFFLCSQETMEKQNYFKNCTFRKNTIKKNYHLLSILELKIEVRAQMYTCMERILLCLLPLVLTLYQQYPFEGRIFLFWSKNMWNKDFTLVFT